MPGLTIQATPFFPGRASGTLKRDPNRAAKDTILLVTQATVSRGLPTAMAGLVVVGPAPLSHAMIGLLRLGVPTVLVTHSQAQALVEDTCVCIDGGSGRIGDPGEVGLELDEPAAPFAAVPVAMQDGTAIELRASIADVTGASRAVRRGATSIGLVRSEFLIPEGAREPDSAFYTSVLSELCQAATPLPLTIRLLDLASDKHPSWLRVEPAAGFGSALGLHGGRLYALETVRRVAQAQLEALTALAPRFSLSVLVPALDRTDDFLAWRRRIETEFGLRVPVGAMIETPAAALDIGRWLQAADFAAVGCNDLMQCFFGAERDLAPVGTVPDPYAPALYRFLSYVAEAAGDALERIALCGLLAQMPGVLTLLMGLGYRSFSVDPLLVPHLARLVGHTTATQAAALALQAQSAAHSSEVRSLLGLPKTSVWTPSP